MNLNQYAFKGVTASSIYDGVGFVILCPEDFPSGVKITVTRIKNLFPGHSIRLVIPPKLAADCNDRYAYGVPIDIGDKTITRMINVGVAKSSADWNFVLMAGANVTQNLIKKYLYFCRTDCDFVYPVVNKRWIFSEASINGLLFNRKMMPEAPEDEPDIDMARATWGVNILSAGGKLKAITGAIF